MTVIPATVVYNHGVGFPTESPTRLFACCGEPNVACPTKPRLYTLINRVRKRRALTCAAASTSTQRPLLIKPYSAGPPRSPDRERRTGLQAYVAHHTRDRA